MQKHIEIPQFNAAKQLSSQRAFKLSSISSNCNQFQKQSQSSRKGIMAQQQNKNSSCLNKETLKFIYCVFDYHSINQFQNSMEYYFFCNPLGGYYTAINVPHSILETSTTTEGQSLAVPLLAYSEQNFYQSQMQNQPINQSQDSSEQKKSKKRRTSYEKEIASAKKNSTSNIINHFFSFFNGHEATMVLVKKAINSLHKSSEEGEKIMWLFYNTIKFINVKRGRKYVNSTMLMGYFTPEQMEKNIPDLKKKLMGQTFTNLEEICQIVRRLAWHFLRQSSIVSILTSKRISSVSRLEHLKGRRKVLEAIRSNEKEESSVSDLFD